MRELAQAPQSAEGRVRAASAQVQFSSVQSLSRIRLFATP